MCGRTRPGIWAHQARIRRAVWAGLMRGLGVVETMDMEVMAIMEMMGITEIMEIMEIMEIIEMQR